VEAEKETDNYLTSTETRNNHRY